MTFVRILFIENDIFSLMDVRIFSLYWMCIIKFLFFGQWAPCHAVVATPLLIAFELLLCIYLESIDGKEAAICCNCSIYRWRMCTIFFCLFIFVCANSFVCRHHSVAWMTPWCLTLIGWSGILHFYLILIKDIWLKLSKLPQIVMVSRYWCMRIVFKNPSFLQVNFLQKTLRHNWGCFTKHIYVICRLQDNWLSVTRTSIPPIWNLFLMYNSNYWHCRSC